MSILILTMYDTNEELTFNHDPLDWQLAGLQQTATGYGIKLVTQYTTKYQGVKRRLYATCFSNAASYWVIVKGKKHFVR